MFSKTRGNSQQNLLIRLWNLLTGLIPGKFQGSQRPLSRRIQGLATGGRKENRFDLEISEVPLRDAARARELIELRDWCPETATAVDIYLHDVPSSADGDDQGFGIPDDDRYKQPVDQRVLDITRAAAERLWTPSNTEMAIDRLLYYGDYFAELDFRLRGDRQINAMMFLPTWEMFRVEPQGTLQGFEQRRYLSDSAAIQFPPIKIVHGRYRRNNLYGRSLFLECLEDWSRLKDAAFDLAEATRDIGVNPTIHTMPEGTDKDYKDAYKDEHEMALADGIMAHYYLMKGHELRKLSETYPDLKALIDSLDFWRKRIAMKAGIPLYLMGMEASGAKDISGQPALAYARRVNKIRMVLSEGIKQTLNTELLLKGIPQELWTYRLVWPRISVNVMGANQADVNLGEDEDIADTDRYELLVSPNGHTVYR
jgi:hypothetical protein